MASAPKDNRLVYWLLGALLATNIALGGAVVSIFNSGIQTFRDEFVDLRAEVRALTIATAQYQSLEMRLNALQQEVSDHRRQPGHQGHPHPLDRAGFLDFLDRETWRAIREE